MANTIIKQLTARVAKWDAGEPIWTVEMGGLGPGYEQAIQVTSLEILRALLPKQFRAWKNEKRFKSLRDTVEAEVHPKIKGLGLSGAQFGAAWNLALCLYRRGEAAMEEDGAKDRKILVSKTFPTLAEAAA